MIKYGLIGLLVICSIVTLYQIYLTNSWTSMIKNKQKEYTTNPSVRSNTKPLVHRLEACAICLVCSFILPSQLTSNSFMTPEGIQENNQTKESVAYNESFDALNDDKSALVGAPMVTTALNKGYLSEADAVFSVYSRKDEDLSISLEMLNPGAMLIHEDEFLDLFEGKDLILSDQPMISACDYIVRVSGVSLGERELLLKIEENQYIICDSSDEVCYVINK